MDGIIDTVSAVHPLLPLIELLKSDGKLVLVGALEKPLELPVFPLLAGKYQVTPHTLTVYHVDVKLEVSQKFHFQTTIFVLNFRSANISI